MLRQIESNEEKRKHFNLEEIVIKRSVKHFVGECESSVSLEAILITKSKFVIVYNTDLFTDTQKYLYTERSID